MQTKIIFIILIFFHNPGFNQEFQWVNSFGHHTSDYSASTTVDQYGNVYITGYATQGTIIGTYTLENRGIYVAKFDSGGQFLWAKESDGAFDTQSSGITCDSQNNVIVTGYYSSGISFEGIQLPNAIQPRMFLVKYDTDGNLQWAKSFGSINLTEKTFTNSLTVDNEGMIYITGAFNRFLVFDDIMLESKNSASSTHFDIFLAKIDGNGNAIWAKRAGGKYSDYAYSISIDSKKNIYISGVFQSKEADFDSIFIDLENTNLRDFVAKFDTSGNATWVKYCEFDNGGFAEATNINTDNKGNLYAYGNYFGTIIFGNDTLADWGNYLLKLDSAGNNVFVKNLKTGNAIPNNYMDGTWWRKRGDIAIDHDNNIFLSANFRDTLVFESDTLISYQNQYGWGSSDIFVVKYNEIGYPQWAVKAGGSLDDYANSIAIDSTNLYISGYYSSLEAAFGNYTITNNSGNNDNDFYLAGINDTSQNICPVINSTLISSNEYICEGDSVLLTCESNYGSSYLWIINDTISHFQYSNKYWVNDSLTAYVLVNPNTICSDTSNTIKLNKYPKPIVEIEAFPDSILCPDSMINLSTYFDTNYQYFWYQNDQLVDSVFHNLNVFSEGIYVVIVNNSFCYNADTFQVISKDVPIIDLPQDTLITYVFPVIYDAGQSDSQYYWMFEDNSDTISFTSTVELTEEGMYYVFLTNECGSDNDSLFVDNPLYSINENGVSGNEIIIFPNPANNIISILENNNDPVKQIKIYNQYGQLVVQVKSLKNNINVSSFDKGIYMLIVETKRMKYRRKLIIN